MAGALESSITLDDVFAMVGNKRVPLAPELAGYLALEIAEGADEAGGDVDPRSVYIAEEGTVALVKRRDAAGGDAEGSIRVMLGRLLDSSGSTTAALTSAAKRRSTGSLRALSEELEAALIPVNRAAGRRALARLAREVKRVTMRVGRSSGAGVSAGVPSSRPPPAPIAMPEEAPTARREALPDLVQRTVPSARGAEPARPAPAPLEVIEAAAPAPAPERPHEATTARPPPRPPEHSAADVDSLLAEFSRASQRPDQAVARDLKAMAGLDPTPPPPGTAGAAPQEEPISNRPSDAGVEALLAMSDPTVDPPRAARAAAPHTPLGPPFHPPPRAAPLPPLPQPEPPPKPRVSSRPPATPAQAPSSKRVAAARAVAEAAAAAAPAAAISKPRLSQAEIPTGTAHRKQGPVSRISTGEFKRMAKPRSDAWLVVLLMALIGVGVGIVWTLKPGFLTGRTPEKIAQEKAAAEAARQQALQTIQANACKVTLEIADAPTNAEVLLREGQAPVDVDRMPVGARLEFVATAEGFAPKRAVVPAGVAWDTGAGNKPRFEVAVQLDKSAGKKGDVWPPGEPGSEVGGKGAPGVVHIVATPRGAEVWLLAGLGPDARIEGLPCDQDVDVLVAGPTTLRKRVHVAASTFAPGPEAPAEGRFAKVSAK
jgi:hypothetical protein